MLRTALGRTLWTPSTISKRLILTTAPKIFTDRKDDTAALEWIEQFAATKPDDIPKWSLDFQTLRASGPGGQSTNKRETKVRLMLPLRKADFLPDYVKDRARALRSVHYSASSDALVFESQETRSQDTNKKTTIAKLHKFILSMASKDLVRPVTDEEKRQKHVKAEHLAECRMKSDKLQKRRLSRESSRFPEYM